MASLDLSALKFINFSSVIVCVKVVENVLQSKLKCVTSLLSKSPYNSQTDRFVLKKKKSRRNVVCGLVARGLRLVKSEEIKIIIVDPKKLEHF